MRDSANRGRHTSGGEHEARERLFHDAVLLGTYSTAYTPVGTLEKWRESRQTITPDRNALKHPAVEISIRG
jgi:hypothetical protein